MQEIGFGHILFWFLIGGLFAGYLIWKIASEASIKKKVSELRKSAQSRKVKVVELEHARSGLVGIICVLEDENAGGIKVRFVPRKFTSGYGFLTIDVGEYGNLYGEIDVDNSAAWLELRNFSSWGFLDGQVLEEKPTVD